METRTGSSMRIKKRIEVTGTSADQVNKSTRDASLHCFWGWQGKPGIGQAVQSNNKKRKVSRRSKRENRAKQKSRPKTAL